MFNESAMRDIAYDSIQFFNFFFTVIGERFPSFIPAMARPLRHRDPLD